jgi:hypothetical protein
VPSAFNLFNSNWAIEAIGLVQLDLMHSRSSSGFELQSEPGGWDFAFKKTAVGPFHKAVLRKQRQ